MRSEEIAVVAVVVVAVLLVESNFPVGVPIVLGLIVGAFWLMWILDRRRRWR